MQIVNGNRGSKGGNHKAKTETEQMICNIAILFQACCTCWHPLLCCELELAIFPIYCHFNLTFKLSNPSSSLVALVRFLQR